MTVDQRGIAPSFVVPLAVGSVAFALDQLSKRLVTTAIGPGQRDHEVALVEPLIRFEYVENRGAAFGLFRGASDLLAVLAIAVVIALGLFYLRISTPSGSLAVGVGLILGGAMGNLVDRLRLGFVIDFVAVGPWPKFNVADSAISLGVVLVAFALTLVASRAEAPCSRVVSTCGEPIEQD